MPAAHPGREFSVFNSNSRFPTNHPRNFGFVSWSEVSAGVFEFFANHLAKGVFQGLFLLSDVLAKRGIDEALVVATTSLGDLVLEPIDHIIVESNRDAGFALGDGQNRAALALLEIIFFLHGHSS